MDIVQTQIPIATNEWLNLDLSEVIEYSLTKQDITNLKSIKKVPADKDVMFAPFCILFGLEPMKCSKLHDVDSTGQAKNISWHQSAQRVIILPNFLTLYFNFERDCLKENLVQEVFGYLNRDELQLDKVYAFNQSLGNLVKWCQATVAYHIITHPYKVRNIRMVQPGSDLNEFAQNIDLKMSKFYSFKQFLLKTNKISKKTNFAFNLKHSKIQKKVDRLSIKALTADILEKIFLFLNPKDALEKKLVCKAWNQPVNCHWDSRLVRIIENIETIKVIK